MWHSRRADVWTVPAAWWVPAAMGTFTKMSLPLLVGLYLPGFAMAAVFVLATAPTLGRRIWPRLSIWAALGYGVGAMLLMWAVPFEGTVALLTARCGTDAPGVLYPALAATLAYLGLGYAAVVRSRPSLWLLGSLLVPVVHAVTTTWLLYEGVARQLPC